MNLADNHEKPGSIALWKRVCNDPVPWLILSAVPAVAAVVLAVFSFGESSWYPESTWDWRCFVLAFIAAALSCVCPVAVIWAQENGWVSIGYTISRNLFIANGAVVAIAIFVFFMRALWSWKVAVLLYFGYAVAVVIHVFGEIARHRKDKESNETAIDKETERNKIELAQREQREAVLKAVQLSDKRRGLFLSIAAAEVFDAVQDAYKLETEMRNTSARDGDTRTNGRTEC